MDLDGASVLLTGASSGIGAATAPALAERGARLVLVARRADRLEEVADACRAAGATEVEAWPADLSDPDAAAALAERVDRHVGGLDVLVNNAGIPMRRHVLRLTVEEIERTMDLNHRTPMRMTLAVLPGMVERARGCIVNVSSVGGRFAIPGEAAYCAAKFAMCGWTETLAADLWDSGVSVRLIIPGPIATEIWEVPDNDAPFYDGPLEPPSLVAEGIADAIEGEGVEHYLPDLRPIVEFKTSDIDTFLEGSVAAMAEAHPDGPSGESAAGS